MFNGLLIGGWLMIAIGVLFLAKPNILRRGVWRDSITQRLLSPSGYVKYMRAVGAVYIVTGVLFLLWGYKHR